MGNEKSQPAGLIIEEKPIQAYNFWTLHSATFGSDGNRRVTVFIGATESGIKPTALERFSKNLKVHRHPSILKYVASWKVNGQFHLATEEVRPLSQVLSEQTPLQICIGLLSILKALNFLHDKAFSSHNNICQAAVYVNSEGQWKLGGMEYLSRFSDVSAGFLAESRTGRYEKGIAPGEETRVPRPLSAIDQFAYGVMAEEILQKVGTDEVPGAEEFLALCIHQLQAIDCTLRPSIKELLQHDFFNHQFVTIYSFLSELPLKAETEKQLFFRNLINKLVEYNEEVIATQLGILLLSRIVLLDSTAQQQLLPQILNPKSEERPECLFSERIFRAYIAPKLRNIFCVRDVQVRLVLLAHFKSFCSTFTLSELQSVILPELLVGIKDTNDSLVAATLCALADLVPLLGAATVIGGKRGKHFSDGRPKMIPQSKARSRKMNKARISDINAVNYEERELILPERPSPDGGEAPSTSTTTEEEESETWDSWEPPNLICNSNEQKILESPNKEDHEESVPSGNNTVIQSLDDLDFKNVELQTTKDEVDFFSDMEPVISKPNVLHIMATVTSVGVNQNEENLRISKFDVTNCETDLEEGWGDELEWADVGDESDSPKKSLGKS